MSSKNVMVIGGAGYIGSHVCKTLAQAGYYPITYDSLQTGHRWAVKWGPLIEDDILDLAALQRAFSQYNPMAVFHLASLINARESTGQPGLYFRNNMIGTLHVLEAMQTSKVPYLIFSSSASVYGQPKYWPIDEEHPLVPLHPYGKSKLACEFMIEDFCKAHSMHYTALRYFNAAGADPDGEIGEAHLPETHLIPLIIEVIQGKRDSFQLFGNQHPTPDGTAIRDYIHVTDLALAHLKAYEWMQKHNQSLTVNLGSGQGYSNLEIIKHFESMISRSVPVILSSQTLEPARLIANWTKAKQLLNWEPAHSDLAHLLSTAWKWHSK
jgi:UDP-arabinose 4-epimerase